MPKRDPDVWEQAAEARAMLDDQLKGKASHLFVDIGLPSSDADATDISLRVHTSEREDADELIDTFNGFPVVIQCNQDRN